MGFIPLPGADERQCSPGIQFNKCFLSVHVVRRRKKAEFQKPIHPVQTNFLLHEPLCLLCETPCNNTPTKDPGYKVLTKSISLLFVLLPAFVLLWLKQQATSFTIQVFSFEFCTFAEYITEYLHAQICIQT